MPKTDKNGVIHYNAESRSDYLSFISEFPRVGTPSPGGIYTHYYEFTKNPDFAKIPLAKKWFYSFQPISICLYVSQKNKIWLGLNLNQLSVTTRKAILKHMRKSEPEAFSESKKKLRFKQFYSLVKLFSRTPGALRKYKMERDFLLRAVPPDEIENLILFTQNDYWKGTYQSVIRRRK